MNKLKYLNDVLTPFEAELIIKDLEAISYEEYTSIKMMKKHSILEKLNMQVVKNALGGGDDYILEYFVTYDKITDIIKELLISRHWKTNVFPIIKDQICEISTVKTYVCLYHEAVIVNLLENFFYHLTACQAAGDYLIEVVEYCYQRISKLLCNSDNKKNKLELKSSEEILKITDIEEMEMKLNELELPIGMSCISIMRYISDHLSSLPFPVRHHMINVKDILLVLIPVLEYKPWIKKDKKGVELIYEAHRWVIKDQNSAKLPKIEGQIWITVFNIFMGQETSKKYEINDFRKNNLLRLKKYMNEVLFDQIPPLHDLFRALEELNLMSTNNSLTSNPFIVEMVAEISRSLEKLNVKDIALKQLNLHFKNVDLKKEYELLSDAYNLDNIEYFMEDPTCGSCGKAASQRCRQCKSEWYCSKECQIKRWNTHKIMCKKLALINESELKYKKESEAAKKDITPANKENINNNNKIIIQEITKNEEKNDEKKEEKKEEKREFDELD